MAATNPAIPPAVRRQAARADRLYREAYPQAEGEPSSEEAAEEQPPTEPEPVQQEEPAPEPEPVAEASEEGPELARAEQRYKVLQGKYNAEVPRLAQQLRQVEEELANTRQVLASVQQPAAAAPPSSSSAAHDYSSLISDEERQEYGDDLLDVVGRRAEQTLMPRIEQILQQRFDDVESRLGSVSQSVARSSEDRLKAALAAAVPDWDVMNSDAGFNSWLNGVDLFSGSPRRKLLHEAYSHGDSDRVIAFFQAYKQEHAAVSPPETQEPGKDDTPSDPTVPLEKLVAPGKPSGQTASAQKQEDPVWRQSQIAQFYRDVVAGKYRGREKEKARIEREIISASNAGRVFAG